MATNPNDETQSHLSEQTYVLHPPSQERMNTNTPSSVDSLKPQKEDTQNSKNTVSEKSSAALKSKVLSSSQSQLASTFTQDVAVSSSTQTNDNISQELPATSKHGEKWKSQEVQVIPKNNMYIVFPALMLTLFLASLDQTIVTIILPKIIDDLKDASAYSWVGTAYLLVAGASAPIYGRLAELVGPKRLLCFSIGAFILGSGLCGGSTSMKMLCVSRGIQGVGGGGIIQLIQITIGYIIPLQKRGPFIGMVGAVWGISSVLGPLIGGALAQYASWRWAFYINLPTAGVAATIIFFFLKTNARPSKTFRQHVQEFDFIGLFLIVSGVALLLVGFSEGENDWSSAQTISCIVIGFFSIVAGAINEIFTSRIPIVPPRLFRTRTTAVILITVFLHAFNFFCGTYYIPLSYQATGSSATMAGIILLPYSLGSSFTSFCSGFIVNYVGDYRQVIWIGWALTTVGMGLITLLNENSTLVERIFFTLIAGAGIGFYFQPPLLALHASMPHKDMATSTATFGLMRTVGGTLGISIGSAIYTSKLQSSLKNYPELGFSAEEIIQQVTILKDIQPVEKRDLIIHEFMKAIRMIWIVTTPIVGVGFILTLLIRKYGLQRKVEIEKRERKDQEEEVKGINELQSTQMDKNIEKETEKCGTEG